MPTSVLQIHQSMLALFLSSFQKFYKFKAYVTLPSTTHSSNTSTTPFILTENTIVANKDISSVKFFQPALTLATLPFPQSFSYKGIN